MAKDHGGQEPGLGFDTVCVVEVTRVDPVASADKGTLHGQRGLMDCVKYFSNLNH